MAHTRLIPSTKTIIQKSQENPKFAKSIKFQIEIAKPKKCKKNIKF